MNPSHSPPARIVPSVSSPSIVARDARAAPESAAAKGVRPFLLRSTTPLGAPARSTHHAESIDQDKVGLAKLPRSKTESALAFRRDSSPSSSSSSASSLRKTRPPLRSAPASSTLPDRQASPRPRGEKHSSAAIAAAKSLPVRASRKIVFVPDPSPPHSTSSSGSRISRTTSTRRVEAIKASPLERAQAVEKRKSDLKRESLLSRRNRAPQNCNDENTPQSESPRIWSLRPVRESSPRPTPNLDSPEPGPPESPSPVHRQSRLTAARPSIRDPSPLSSARTASTEQLRKKASYGALELRDEHEQRKLPSSRTGYTSLQEILAEQGYRDTRVVTPNSKLRATQDAAPDSNTLLVPPPAATAQIKNKSSILSLRGLFSLWSPTETAEPLGTPVDHEVEQVDEAATRDPPSPTGSGGTFTHSPISRAREWVQGVAIATAQDDQLYRNQSPCPVESITFTPPLQHTTSTISIRDDSPSSSRSYSSSIVTASSIRSPPLVTIALPGSTVALSPPLASFADERHFSTCGSGLGNGISTRPTPAIKSLRHVVSDSTLPHLVPHYTSFPFSPSSCDSDGSSRLVTSPRPVAKKASFLSPETNEQSGTDTSSADASWFPRELRHRASQVFSIGLGLSATPTTPFFPLQQQQRSKIALDGHHNRRVDQRKPKLLRRAVSSAGLVRPVLTTSNY
ncbi:uncharacterized protein JCM15063_002002 [Sporobolomyces koalae]|uniref:uncharacterized protein n=1 Tax=Sporobolomyces koalae TaxID=500713 RepID=UPI0031742A78